jgi:nuclear pore complex protein Nup155
MVLERDAARQTVAFCGVFPEIRRAWASVDNSLFLWRFDKWCAGCGGGAAGQSLLSVE